MGRAFPGGEPRGAPGWWGRRGNAAPVRTWLWLQRFAVVVDSVPHARCSPIAFISGKGTRCTLRLLLCTSAQLMIHLSWSVCRNACAGSKGRSADGRAGPCDHCSAPGRAWNVIFGSARLPRFLAPFSQQGTSDSPVLLPRSARALL